MTGFQSKRGMAQAKTSMKEEALKRPVESDYTSLTAYTRALEWYCNSLAQPPLPVQKPQRPWVGLTDEEIDSVFQISAYQTIKRFSPERFARAIEAKLKEKNNANN